MLENLENKLDKKAKIIVDGICIYTKFEKSDINEKIDTFQNAARILHALINPVQTKLPKLQRAGEELAQTAIENKSDILLKHALGLKEATTIMLSNNSSEKESLKIAMAKKLKSLNKQINSLSKKLEQKENIEKTSPNTNKRKGHQNEEESSVQFSNVISKDSNKQQKNHQEEVKDNIQQNFTVNTPN